ncbi:MAG TPA: Gfo/Idh/MocA family oxidoreductase [Acidimicrobiales bacterium]|nr:Gfo/Idh/MocA family oxidoreductase [Acidimicrobiales bacterium]
MTDTRVSEREAVRLAVVGVGYWGPNLIRNFRACPDTELLWVCEAIEQRARRAIEADSPIRVTPSFQEVLDDDRVEAVAIATPPETHAELGTVALSAGRHGLMEKPLAPTVESASALVRLAAERNLVLMSDHTYCYTPAVQKIRELVQDGVLGDLYYFDSVRINLGLIQTTVDVVWDLAPHDLSILDFILPSGGFPSEISAHLSDPLGIGRASVGHLTLPLSSGGIGHIHVNWLSPVKIRRTILSGSRKMLVWDDLAPGQRISLFDSGVDLASSISDAKRHELFVSYRVGDMVAPALPEREALAMVAGEFAAAIRESRPPMTDGNAGLRVVRALTAAETSAACRGAYVPLSADSQQ